MSAPIQRIRAWFSRLVHRPADLFDIASGIATPLFVLLAAWNYDNPELAPSMSFLPDVAPLWLWLLVVGLAGIGQPIVLHYDEPSDRRHPFLQPTKWARSVLALIVGFWFSVLFLSMWARIGPHHTEAMYGLMMGMSAYIIAHVLFRPRGGP